MTEGPTQEPGGDPAQESEELEALSGEIEDPEGSGEAQRRPPDATTSQIVEAYSHSGPVPSEQWFAAVERLHPGSTELMLNDYVQEREHQRDLQKRALDLDENNLEKFASYQMSRLLIVGLIALVVAGGGVAAVLLGHQLTGLAILVGELATLVFAFFGRRQHGISDGEEVPSAPEE